MAWEKVVATYDREGKARDAVRALEASGFPSSDISLLNRERLGTGDIKGAWRKFFGNQVGDRESAAYSRAVEAGGAVLTVRAPSAEIPRAMKILDVHSRVDTGESNAGYTARTEMSIGTEKSPVVDIDSARRAEMGAKTPDVESARRHGGDTGTVGTPAREEVLRLAEEQLNVGKRVVEIGKARVRRFIVEKPVESKITLHEEHAQMMRRPVADAEPLRDVDWSDKTFDISETAEQAVVNKTARVVEEAVIRVEGSDRVETVRDTVRRQQVELERRGADRLRDTDTNINTRRAA